jgi:hypothetical protein
MNEEEKGRTSIYIGCACLGCLGLYVLVMSSIWLISLMF